MSLMWEGLELNCTMVTGYHDVSAHECAGNCTKCTTYPAGYRINGTLCTGKELEAFKVTASNVQRRVQLDNL